MTLDFHAGATDELLDTVVFYEEKASGLGADFLNEVERLLGLIESQPEIAPVWLHGARRIPLRRFPYNLVYRATKQAIVIVAIAHQRRKPTYWSAR